MAKQGMPAWTKAPPELVQRFEKLREGFPSAQKRTMFGYPVAFVCGQMCFGLFQDRVMMRLSAADRESIAREHGAVPFEPVPGRPMREYVEVPAGVLSNPGSIRTWIARSVTYVSSLPPKVGKRGAKGASSRKTGPDPRGG